VGILNDAYDVGPAARREVDHLIYRHYLRRWPGVVTFVVGLFDQESISFIGAIVFALPPRETAKRYGVGVAWELARLFIEDVTPKNAETWFMARAIKLVKKIHPEVDLLVSYSDTSAGHTGTIYRAGNWIPDGHTDQGRKSPRCDYVANGKKYSRKAHVPDGVQVVRVPRISKARFVYWTKRHEERRAASLRDIRGEDVKIRSRAVFGTINYAF